MTDTNIFYETGDIQFSTCQTIVVPVNCEGTMNKGIASIFRRRYPYMFERYKWICEQGLLAPGKLWIYNSPSKRKILIFPVLQHGEEIYRYMELGLAKFLATYQEKGITSVAFPLFNPTDTTEKDVLGLLANKDALIRSLLDGSYRPNPVKRVEIPKDNGKMRMLGIPTVIDRLVQQAINQTLTPIYERQFSPGSYGFRPRRGCHDALRGAQKIIDDGYIYVVDLDLERFFDTVSHSKLIEILSRTIKDGRVISLIHKYLRSGVMNKCMFEASEEGTPQGGPLSPLLSNIMLNELDKELTRRGLPFVRYADDSMIFCKSKRAAKRVKESVTRFIEGKLHLKVNMDKTVVSYVQGVKYLGYSFYVMKGKCQLTVHPKAKAKMKARLKELTSRSNGWGYAKRKQKLEEYIRGGG